MRVTERGDSVVIAIEDQGAGIPRPLIHRVGEPFFTTKPPGRGMGLGVFLARAMVERLGGQLRFESSPGEGTTALMQLPRARMPTDGPSAPRPAVAR